MRAAIADAAAFLEKDRISGISGLEKKAARLLLAAYRAHRPSLAIGCDTDLGPSAASYSLEASLDRESDQARCGGQAKPLHQDSAVHLDGFLGQSEFSGDLLVE